MNGFLVLLRKELNGYFLSPVAYATSTFFLAVMGVIFHLLASILAEGVPGVGVMNLLFNSPFYWMTMLVVIPLLTMRLFAEERRMGTLEHLLTAPVTDRAVVAAKFGGVFIFYLLMWMPTLLFLLGLHLYSADRVPLDPGAVAAGYLGVLLSGGFFLAWGLLCSLTTANQIIAAIICFAGMILCFMAGFLDVISYHPVAVTFSELFAPHRNLAEFSRGIVDSRPVVAYVSGTVLLLFASTRMLEARQWK